MRTTKKFWTLIGSSLLVSAAMTPRSVLADAYTGRVPVKGIIQHAGHSGTGATAVLLDQNPAGCTSNIRIDGTDTQAPQLLSVLLAAFLAKKTVNIRFSGTGDSCIIKWINLAD